MSDEINVILCGCSNKKPLPETAPDKCPDCGCKETEGGYGLAGGGIGFYESCLNCGKIVSKIEDEG